MVQRKPFPRTTVVLSIVVLVIAAIVFLQYQSSVRSAEEAALRKQLFLLRDALDEYQANTRTCPDSLPQLVADKYIRALPVDPSTKSSATWRYTQTRMGERIVCDVKTTSPKVARDGIRYADW